MKKEPKVFYSTCIIPLMLTIFMLASCLKPANLVTPAGYISANVNGKTLSAKASITYSGGPVSVPILKLVISTYPTQEIDLLLSTWTSNGIAIGTYIIANGASGNCEASYNNNSPTNADSTYHTNANYTGKLVINTGGNTISGGFYFKAQNFWGDTVIVNSGVINQVTLN